MNPFADPSAIRSHMVNDQHRMPVRVVHADTGQRDRPAGLLPSPGPAAARTLDDLVVADGPQMTLSAFCDAADTTGLLVRHRGRVVHADYRHGFAPTDLHVTASVSKSVFALLLSHLIHTETIDPDARIESFVPELAGTGFGRASIDHAFHMLTTVRYGGRPFHKETEARAFFAAVGMIPLPADHDGPRTLLDRLATAEEDAPSGRVFRYENGNTEALGEVVRRVTGASVSGLLETQVYAHLAAGADAHFGCDPTGRELVSGRFASTLADLTLLGEMIRGQGALGERQILPESVVADYWASPPAPADDVLGTGDERAGGPVLAYRRGW